MRPTQEQIQAIETQGRALLVDAGAGSGKTWVLVERFIHLLEQHPDWPLESILAVTFTEKATREMRSRIRRAVEQRATASVGDSQWINRRRQLEYLHVSTIHGLCAHILRENAIAAGIDPRFGVLEEQDADFLKEQAIQETISELVENDSPALNLLVSSNVRDLKDEMSSLLAKRGTVHILFEQLPGEQTLLEKWAESITEMRVHQWQEQLHQTPGFQAAMDNLADLPISDPDDKLAPAVECAMKGIALAAAGEDSEAVEEWLRINLSGGKRDNWGGAERLAEIKEYLKSLKAVATKLEKSGFTQRFGEADQAAARSLQLWKQLWEWLNQTYDRLKDDRQVLDFDDLELLTARLLRLEPRAERLEAFLAGINHLMVDEFQDTNNVQRDIIFSLAHAQDGGRLFLVGDAKQSIYRFRQAQVSIFNQTIQAILTTTGCDPLPLSRSFRTHRLLVKALNHLFERILQPQYAQAADFEARPGPLSAQRESPPAPASTPAPIELILLPDNDDLGETLSAQDGRLLEAQLLAQRILELEREGYPVWDNDTGDYRPMHFSDAAVLFRATTNFPLYEEEFKKAGLPYLTVSGRGYYDRPEVQDLIALLTCLHNPGDDLNLAAALRSPLFSLNDESLYRLRWHADSPPERYAAALGSPPPTDQEEQVRFAAQVLDELWGMAGRVPIWWLLRVALDRTGYEAALLLEDQDQGGGTRQLGNVSKFLELTRKWGGTSPSDFLRRLQDLRAREAREGEALGSAPESGAVQLMSIHAAKGLEFPVVFVADLGRSRRSGFGSPRILHDPAFGLVCKQRDQNGDWHKPVSYLWGEWLDEKMEAAEDKRLLYVACTRAAELLILSGKTSRSSSWLMDILDIWDIPQAGPEEQLLPVEDFSLRILRPRWALAEDIDRPIRMEPSPGLTEMPSLAIPLADTHLLESISVTDLTGAHTFGDDHPPPVLRTIFRSYGSQDNKPTVSPYTIGVLVHRALADWDCLSLPERALVTKLDAYARQEGITSDVEVHYAIQRARKMINNLRRSALFAEINIAPQRLTELPFNLRTQEGDIYGVIDLLYQDEAGEWHLIDWKTEWTSSAQLEQHVREYASQMHLYARAVRDILGKEPEMRLCFLWPQLLVTSP
jgi:ATP-dependent helicase/nuclease subunit A